MIWNNWHDFFNMGGYGLYVWGSFVVTFGLMGAEVVGLMMRAKANRAALLRQLAMQKSNQ